MTPLSTHGRLAEMPLAVRIAVFTALFGLLVVGAASVSGYRALARQLDMRVAAELAGKRELVRHVLSEIAAVEQVVDSAHRFTDLLIGHNDLHLAVVEPQSGRVLASFSRVARVSAGRFLDEGLSEVSYWQGADGVRYASLGAQGQLRDGGVVRLVLSQDLRGDEKLLAGFNRGIGFALPVVLLVIAAGAWVVARTGLLPLRHFSAVAASINSRSLGQRLEPHGLPAELKALANHFNGMLDRIEEGMARLTEFSGDLAHEMRTPVATLMGRTQVTLSKARTADELRDVLAGNIEELERLTRLITDMLFLARTEQDGSTVESVPLDLAAEARGVADFLSVVAEERGVEIEVSGEGATRGDRILVQRAITNLLTNAIRHAAAHSVVTLTVQQIGGAASLRVTNTGDGIAPDQLHRVFERFVRLDVARGRSDGGSGLGLAIVQAIMRAHKGSAISNSTAGGQTSFTLFFAESPDERTSR